MSERSLVTGKRAVLEAIKSGRAQEVRVADTTRATQGLREVLDAAAAAGTPLREVPRDELDSLAEDHRGVVAYAAAPSELSERDISTLQFSDDAIAVVLDGITDTHNLGACARAADAAGAELLITRTKRAAAVTPAAIRASSGALLSIPHARVANVTRAIERLKDAGFTVVGLDAEAPVDVFSGPCPEGRVALVVGSEGEGISRLVRESCDRLVCLPMLGKVASLNASNSLSAALFSYVLARGR